MLACETLVAEAGAGTQGLSSPNPSASIASLPFRDPIPTLVLWQVSFYLCLCIGAPCVSGPCKVYGSPRAMQVRPTRGITTSVHAPGAPHPGHHRPPPRPGVGTGVVSFTRWCCIFHDVFTCIYVYLPRIHKYYVFRLYSGPTSPLHVQHGI